MVCAKSTGLALGLWYICLLQAVALLPAPIVVEPSQYWEGVDGAWSTFSLRIGSPEQVVRTLVSTAIPNVVTTANSSCPNGPSSTCASSRGGVFAPNSSSTWQYRNTFGLYPELNYTTEEEPAYYGLDTVGLGLESSGTTLHNQVVAAVQSTDYYLGYLGVDPQTTNWTLDFTVQTQSFFKTLSTENLIPSFTYSYTAGAKYQSKGVLGSLVFGGYDSSRVAPQDGIVFTMADDVSRDLVVAIQAITTDAHNKPAPLLPGDGVLAFIDSTFPYFVLPLDACEAFEAQFGLEWNPSAGNGGLYTLTDSQHEVLQKANPSITFTLSDSLTGGAVTNITLPYAAFDLQASPPLVNSTTNYFPLLRAANESQITLGRAFLQEAMLVVDYTQNNFSIWPCVWNADASETIIALEPQNTSNSTSVNDNQVTSQQSTSSLRIGLGVGLGLGALLLALLIYVLIARHRQSWPFRVRPSSRKPIYANHSGPAGSELEAKPNFAHDPDKLRVLEMAGVNVYEADGLKRYTELSSSEADKTPSINSPTVRSELAGSEPARELPNGDPYNPREIPGVPVPSSFLQARPSWL